MNDELDNLQPEVRRALLILDDWLPETDADGKPNVWQTIRAELLRLARNDADAMIVIDSDHDWQVMRERAERAEAEIAAIKHELVQCDDIAIGDDLPRMVCDVQKARERVAAELAALKARIMEAPLHTVSFHIPTGITCIVCDVSMRGQRVRLVVED